MASAPSPSSAGREGSSGKPRRVGRETLSGLVLVYGPGPGLGKSALGRALTERLISQGIPARLIEEHEITTHPAFRGYVRGAAAGRADDAATLIEACRRFVSELGDQCSEITVLDSVLPCWDWLYSAGCSDAEVSAFSRALAGMLATLHPVLVFVEGDLEVALSRAIEDRGMDWALDLAQLRTGRRDLDALGSYFRRLRAGSERMLAFWPHRVVRVDTVRQDLRSCVDQVEVISRGMGTNTRVRGGT